MRVCACLSLVALVVLVAGCGGGSGGGDKTTTAPTRAFSTSRTCAVTLYNATESTLKLKTAELNSTQDSWGRRPEEYSYPSPFGELADHFPVSYRSESVVSRCSNTVTYGDDRGTVTVTVRVDADGSDSKDCSTTGSYACREPMERLQSGGLHAYYEVYVK
jgi:hypothetical protein